jgi:hypothetical protein
VIAAAASSAGGAPLDQLAVLTAVYGGGSAALLWLIEAHRGGRTRLLARAGAGAAFVFRLPPWAALPPFIGIVSLLLVMCGGFWDIGYHIDYGRDDGPLGNPGHWPMLFGFFGSFAAGVLCLGLAHGQEPGPAWVRLGGSWRMPVGGALMIFCSAFGLAALPLDDVWHRIFGQDVTLWSPTHFMLLGGATFSVIGMAMLVSEGGRALSRPAGAARAEGLGAAIGRVWIRIQRVALLGGMLVGLEAFLAEYDWGVPLYRAVWQPLFLAASAALVFTAARAWGGRGGALGAWGIYAIVRLLATLMPVLAGRSPSAMPLLLASALCVELAAIAAAPRARPLVFGAIAGLACGSIGFAAEYGWSQLVMPLPWQPGLIAEGLPTSIGAGLAGGMLGTLLACGLRSNLPSPRVTRAVTCAALALLVGLGVNAAIKETPDARATLVLTDTRPPPDREARAEVRLDPPGAADDANWFYLLGWQGKRDRVIDRLERVGGGLFRSTRPIPLNRTWKVGLRLQRGRGRGAVPVRLPPDPELGARGAELKAPERFTRAFGPDSAIMLREQSADRAAWLWMTAMGVIFAFYALFVAGVALGVGRQGRRGAKPASVPSGRTV